MRKLKITAGDDVRVVWADDEGVTWDKQKPGTLDDPSDWQHNAADEWLFHGRLVPGAIVDILEDETTTHLSGEWRLTTAHPESICGIPVLINGRGDAFGPRAPVVFAGEVMPAHRVVERLAQWNGLASAPMVVAFARGVLGLPPAPPPGRGVEH